MTTSLARLQSTTTLKNDLHHTQRNPLMKSAVIARILATAIIFGVCHVAAATTLPDMVVPDGLGVNIHFIDPQPGEMKMIAEAGFHWIRMDFSWSDTEREKDVYDFAAYDRLMAAIEPHHIRAVLILDYNNRHYDNGLSPASDEGRAAFARWAVAAAHHFRNRGVLWEMYNEPNLDIFWKPKPNARQYAKLAIEVGKALRQAEPNELFIGPAFAGCLEDTEDGRYLETCFKSGILEYWSGVSVHPYRESDPETVVAEYRRLRRMIDQYAPKGKTIPILSSEWGYEWRMHDSDFQGADDVKQGKMLSRMWLTNMANNVPLSIWYDWRDDGQDPKNKEHHFGTVLSTYHGSRTPVYEPKPAYRAAKTFSCVLNGCRFQKRLAVGGPDDYVMQFAKGNDVRWVAWTTATAPHTVVIPVPPGRYVATQHTGEALPPLVANAKGLVTVLTDSPMYLVPEHLQATFHVAPDGSDNNPGDEDKVFATIEGAGGRSDPSIRR
jgi:polysaccharide biosynthesis protein PslG